MQKKLKNIYIKQKCSPHDKMWFWTIIDCVRELFNSLQVRCKDKYLCNTAGTKIVLTDQNNDNTTDIVLSKKAFSAMALKGKAQRLLNTGRVDVEYKRYEDLNYKPYNN